MDSVPYAAVVLAGGAARRLGGAVKPALPVAGRPMLDRVLGAVGDASVRVVVGPPGLSVPSGVLLTREEPPGGGPVAGAAAGLVMVPATVQRIALLACDLPLLDARAVAALRAALDAGQRRPACTGDPVPDPGGAAEGTPLGGAVKDIPAPNGAAVAVFVDRDGHRQNLCGLWRAGALRSALDGLAARRGSVAGASVRALLQDVHVVEVSSPTTAPPPWFDCDTDADLRRAEEWAS